MYGREINVYVTNDKDRAVIHRRNELMLNEYPNIAMLAIYNKMENKKGTEPAYCLALGIDIEKQDPYEFLLMDKKNLRKIATKRENYLENKLMSL